MDLQSIKKASRLRWYLILIAALSAFCYATLNVWLLPYSITHQQTGMITPWYVVYAVIGIFFSTPAPFLSVLVIYLFREKKGLKKLFRDIFHTEDKLKTTIITAGFCLFALVYTLLCGKPNGAEWYMFFVGFAVMLPFVGIAEETGWRGLLQPELDKRMPFPLSTLVTAAIWFVWHLPLWTDPTSNHYDDSIIGFGITIFIWAFALAALYKATKSIIACAVYHTFMDSIGAVYDWNSLFDPFPGNAAANIYRAVWLTASLALWIYADIKEKKTVAARKQISGSF